MDTLLIFKVTVGVKDLDAERASELCRIVQDHFNKDTIPNHILKFFIIPNREKGETDIELLYPVANSLLSQGEVLDLMIQNGTVPASILESINKEIKS